MSDVTVLAISAADLFGGSNHSGPYRSCGSLRDGLPLEQRLALRGELLIPLFYDLFDLAGVYVASQFGVDYSRVHCGSTYAAIPMAFVEGNREENVRRLGSSIGNERLVRRPLKVGILEVDIRIAVTQRRKIDQPPATANQRGNTVNQDKVAKMIGTELCFEAVDGVAERRGHHSGIGNDHIERLCLRQQSVGTGTHAFQVGKIEFNQFEASATGSRVLSHLLGRGPGLAQIPCCAYDLGAVRGQGACRFHAEPSRSSRYEDPFALQIHAGQDVIRGRSCSK